MRETEVRFRVSTRFYGAFEVVEEVGSGVLNFHSFRRRNMTGDIIGASPYSAPFELLKGREKAGQLKKKCLPQVVLCTA